MIVTKSIKQVEIIFGATSQDLQKKVNNFLRNDLTDIPMNEIDIMLIPMEHHNIIALIKYVKHEEKKVNHV